MIQLIEQTQDNEEHVDVLKLYLSGFIVTDVIFVFIVYRNPDISDEIFDCLLAIMTTVQSVNRKVSFLFVGDVNAHHKEWVESSTTNLQCRATHDFASSLGRNQEPTHIDERVLDLLLTDVPEGFGLARIFETQTKDAVFYGCYIVLEQLIPYLVCRQEVYLKNSMDWELVRGGVKGLY